MPTTPFSDDFVEKLKGPTAWKFSSRLGPVFTPRFFCCDQPNTLGISGGKTPVAVIELDPNPALINETVDYTGTASYDPDGSITDYAWDFEDHTPSSGTADSGTLNYSQAGTYTIELVVTDGTGLDSTPAQEELVVVEPVFAGFLATTNGVFFTNTAGTIVWEDKNSGLSGDDLTVYDVKVDPRTQGFEDDNLTVWRASEGGIQVSTDGGGNWTDKTPGTVSNHWDDNPAPDAGSVSWRMLHFEGNRLFAAGTWQNGSALWRSWVLYTDDDGGSWSEVD